MKVKVVLRGRLSDKIPIDNGVKLGDILAPKTFSTFFSVVHPDTFQHCERSVCLEFRITGRVFDCIGLKNKPDKNKSNVYPRKR